VRSEGADGPEERRYDQTHETGFRREWRHLYDVVTAGATPLTPIADAVKDIELAEAILRKAVQTDPSIRRGAQL
jgi:predicted dehydrogenase